jgi:3,4-dihydroxy 2-butanone 4-phosphate synthase/GTP cyclohydrolase II
VNRFADDLNAAMERAGFNAAQLAQRSGLTESAISYLRAGRREPSYATIRSLTLALPELGTALAGVPLPSSGQRVEAAIEDIRAGKMIIVLDDEERENEGDLVMAADKVTPEAINFMRKEAGGLICVAMTGARLDELQIPAMVADNTAPHQTGFTVSVEARGVTTTGISAQDRALTIGVLLDPQTRPADLLRPGHTFPLRAREGGVLARDGHTEAAIDFARLAGCAPAGVICEIMDDDGSMMRLERLREYGERHKLRLVTIQELIAYRMRSELLVHASSTFRLPTRFGEFQATAYETVIDDVTHIALVMGDIGDGKDLLVRVHTECVLGDALGSVRCDCGEQRDAALEMIASHGRGIFLYLHLEGHGERFNRKLRAYALQELPAPQDKRRYGIGAQMLFDMGVREMRLITNNQKKITGIDGYGVTIVERVPMTLSAPRREDDSLRSSCADFA